MDFRFSRRNETKFSIHYPTFEIFMDLCWKTLFIVYVYIQICLFVSKQKKKKKKKKEKKKGNSLMYMNPVKLASRLSETNAGCKGHVSFIIRRLKYYYQYLYQILS